jgi:hypothetical protein
MIPPRASKRATLEPRGGLQVPAGFTAAMRPDLTQTSRSSWVRSV